MLSKMSRMWEGMCDASAIREEYVVKEAWWPRIRHTVLSSGSAEVTSGWLRRSSKGVLSKRAIVGVVKRTLHSASFVSSCNFGVGGVKWAYWYVSGHTPSLSLCRCC